MIDADERVILVSESDVELGDSPKLEVHRTGALHRAFSVFVVNDRGEMLLQRRAAGKYHSPGLWSNTCCGHPRPGEATGAAAERRLNEEMGLDCNLTEAFSFVYTAQLGQGLVEHELDHVFIGTVLTVPRHDPLEVGEWQWTGVGEVSRWLEQSPEAFTSWFAPAFNQLLERGSLSR